MNAPPDGPLILLDPHPRRIETIFAPEDRRRLEALGRVLWFDGRKAEAAYIDAHLPEAVALLGQTPLPRARLDRAPRLRAVLNVEGNFLPNVDYEECHRRNIVVLSCAPAFAPAVAEMALGLALAAVRGILPGDAAFRNGSEVYGGSTNTDAFLLRGKPLGLLGCGNVGRALLPLLRAFGGEILVHDPWLHDHYLEDLGVTPVGLDELLRRARALFVISAATTENQRGLGARHFALLERGSVVVLVGRSDVVDFDALLDAAAAGHVRAALDVFPQEPLPAEHRARRTPNTILSAHRAGGLPETYRRIGEMAVDDLEAVLRGLAPLRMQRASVETVGRFRGRPVEK